MIRLPTLTCNAANPFLPPLGRAETAGRTKASKVLCWDEGADPRARRYAGCATASGRTKGPKVFCTKLLPLPGGNGFTLSFHPALSCSENKTLRELEP